MDTIIENKKEAPLRKKNVKGAPKLYEAMFLVDPAEAATDWDGVTAAIKSMLEKHKAEIVTLRKWDDRKLAYAINGKSKGTYILCYFKAEGNRLRNIEKDIQLSERIFRALILCAEQRQAEDAETGIASQTAAAKETQRQPGKERRAKDNEPEQTEEPETEDLGEED